jgi:hypothetical protein
MAAGTSMNTEHGLPTKFTSALALLEERIVVRDSVLPVFQVPTPGLFNALN